MHWGLPPAETCMNREPPSSSSSPKCPLSSSSRFVLGLGRLTFTSSFTFFLLPALLTLHSMICCYNNYFVVVVVITLLFYCCSSSCCCRVYERKSMSTERYTIAFCEILLVRCVTKRLWLLVHVDLATGCYCA